MAKYKNIIQSKITGNKYLTVDRATQLQKKFQQIIKKEGLNVFVSFHPTYLKVPIEEEKGKKT